MTHTRLVTAALAVALGALVATDAVQACEASKELAGRRKALAARTEAPRAEQARDHYLLGVWARESGLPRAAKEEFAKVIDLDADHSAAREALGHVKHDGSWLTRSQSMEAKGLVLRGGAWILREEAAILDLPAQQKKLRKEQQAKVRDLIKVFATGGERAQKFARESLGTIDDAVKVEPLAFNLRSKNESVRLLAAEELGKIGSRRALRPLIHRAIHDPSEDVRFAAIDAAKAIGDPNLLVPLVRALGSENSTVRQNAAASIGRTDDVRGVRYLVYRFEAHGGGAPRVYSMFANQLTFIQDFDVEVAQTAFIADPIVSTIQEGIILDVTVVATEQVSYIVEREVIHGALHRLTRATDVENKDGAWAAWLQEHGDELVAAR